MVPLSLGGRGVRGEGDGETNHPKRRMRTAVRRLWINTLLPLIFVALPPAAAGLIFAAIPPAARGEYLKRLSDSAIDWVILGIGGVLFIAQTWLAWRALRWKDGANNFDTSVDNWLKQTVQAAEWFPLLGLIGTVAAILQTFSSFGVPGEAKPTAEKIIREYGPAITATGSGLFMAFLNILPAWIVNSGRNLIRSLAGQPTPPDPADRPIDLVSAQAGYRPGGRA